MKIISFIFLVCYAKTISGFLNSPEEEEEFLDNSDDDNTPIQTFENANARAIETNFDMLYSSKVNCEHSNSPVAPRIDRGYYVAFTDKNKYLHILSYDACNKLLKDFNIKEKAYPVDITSIVDDGYNDDGFAIYMIDANNPNHSYLSLYDKNFQYVKRVTIMDNSEKDDKTVDSNIKKQVIRYENDGTPAFGMRFMYNPNTGKLASSAGRICLIFSHSNYFLDSGENSGDTIVCFNKYLDDMDFGLTWGASGSLIQSVDINDVYFCTASLSDGHPMGIKITYTSLHHHSTDTDPVNKKYNQRKYIENDNLAGIIKGYMNGTADGKLGGLLYFKKEKIYCLVYAKTPDASGDSNNGKNIIYMTTWKFENKLIGNIKTIIVKSFISGKNVMQVRAGKFGSDKVFILYANTTSEGGNGYGNIPKGTVPYFSIIDVVKLKKIKTDGKLNRLLMNTNEDLKTFENDGVLIWATSNKEGKLTINKVGYYGGVPLPPYYVANSTTITPVNSTVC